MFDNPKGTIGVLFNRPEQDYQKELVRLLMQEASPYGYNLAIITTYEIRKADTAYDAYGDLMLDFAPFEAFDACIVCLDTFHHRKIRERLVEALIGRSTGPVISFRERVDAFYSVCNNLNQKVGEVVRYLAGIGRKRIFFMGGYPGHYDADQRLFYYKEAMAQLSLPLYDNSIFQGDLWWNKGEAAYQYFFQNPQALPDAIICANDFMARSLCDVLLEKGLRIPEDVAITGFDDDTAATSVSPEITTLSPDMALMAKETLKLIDDLSKGIPREKVVVTEGKLLVRRSTDPHAPQISDSLRCQSYYQALRRMTQAYIQESYFRIDLGGCLELPGMLRTIKDSLNLLGDFGDFYLCLFVEKDEEGIPYFGKKVLPETHLLMGIQDGKELSPPQKRFPTARLLPREAEKEEPQCFYFTLLSSQEYCFGYTAVSFPNPVTDISLSFNDYHITIGLGLLDFSNYHRLRRLLEEKERLSKTDPLTGLWNRRGIEDFVSERWDSWMGKEVSFFAVDLDYLKAINDTYGHREGDRAIRTVATALQEAMPENAAVSRTGGDEFTILWENQEGMDAETIKEHFLKILEEKAAALATPYPISASVGYYTERIHSKSSYEAALRISDAKMYQIKRERGTDRPRTEGFPV